VLKRAQAHCAPWTGNVGDKINFQGGGHDKSFSNKSEILPQILENRASGLGFHDFSRDHSEHL
jgi:hypothetical protein